MALFNRASNVLSPSTSPRRTPWLPMGLPAMAAPLAIWLASMSTVSPAQDETQTEEVADYRDGRIETGVDKGPIRSPEVIRHAKALKSADYLMLTLRYIGPDHRRYANVLFSKRLPFALSLPYAVTHVRLTEAQAGRIIDVLADQGFLAEAVDMTGEWRPPPKGPCYVLSVGGGDLPVDVADEVSARVALSCDLGWNAAMLRRLDALCEALDGDARKALEMLLVRLEPQRKAWGVSEPAPIERLAEHEVQQYRSLYVKYQQMTADAVKAWDRARTAALTRQFNESVGGKLLHVDVSRYVPGSGADVLINESFGPKRSLMSQIDYGPDKSRTPRLTEWDGYVRVENDYDDDVYICMFIALEKADADDDGARGGSALQNTKESGNGEVEDRAAR